MRVAWVHPSWRDLVIEHLSRDDGARRRFLRGCSIHGTLLALSTAGGQAGARQVPLLRDDIDWDTLTDRVYELVPDLESAELIGLLDGIADAVQALMTSAAEPEVDALARALLGRIGSLWKAAHAPIPLSELEAWFAVARLLSPPPAPPSLGVTWTELLPVAAPALSDYAALERFADWLTLADLLHDHDREVLDQFAFPGHRAGFVLDLCDAIAFDRSGLHNRGLGQARRALKRVPRLVPLLAARADSALYWLGDEAREDPPNDWIPWTFEPADRPDPRAGKLDVQRVLRDL